MLALALLLPALGAVLMLRARKRSRIETPPQAIVLLLREPSLIDSSQMAAAFSRASGRDVAVSGPIPHRAPAGKLPPGDWVAGSPPHFLAQIDGTQFLVNAIPARYVRDAAAPPWSVADPAIHDAVAAHTAWLSAEILHPEAVTLENYRIVSRVLASFVGENCLALFHPPLGLLALCSVRTADALRSDLPVQAVFGEPTAPTPSR